MAPSAGTTNDASFGGFWALETGGGGVSDGGDFNISGNNAWIEVPALSGLVDGVQTIELRMSSLVTWSGTLYFDSILIQ
jgi:hypothetical protein